jgi:pyruvate kinase
LIRAGIDLVRINFSHGTLADHQKRVNAVRECAAALDREVGILGDLQGPKIRIARFQNKCISLEPGQKFVLDATPAVFEGSQEAVGVDYKQLPGDVDPEDILLLDDGRIELQVDYVDNLRIVCTVKTGGELSDNKGINRKGGGLSAGALTAKDYEDLKAAAAMNLDYIAVSFVRHASDILTTRKILNEVNGTAGIIAKIERSEAIEAVDGTDAVMLSGETAIGRHPEKVVVAVERVCLAAERQPSTRISRHRVDRRFKRVDEAISMSAMYAANHLDIKAIVALTESGSTPLWMSRIRTAIPIFGLSRHSETLGKMTLYRNVYPLFFDVTRHRRDEIKREAIGVLERRGFLKAGDMAIITKGDQDGVYGMTNAMKIVEVGHVV